jgi:plastocyanin
MFPAIYCSKRPADARRRKIAFLCGIAACLAWTMAGSTSLRAQDAAKVTINVKNFSFDPAQVTVKPGTTVEWTDSGGKHTIVADDGSFKSPTLTAGEKFEFKFDKPGTYRYYCSFHGSKGGHDMAGTVTVAQ